MEIVSGKSDPFACAERLLKERHPRALVAFVAGSIVGKGVTSRDTKAMKAVQRKISWKWTTLQAQKT
jgi:hypothetical protein